MRNLNKINMRVITAIFYLGLCFSGDLLGVEERPFELLKKDGNIEIREYKRIVSAEVTLSGSRRDTANGAFRILFDYIQGKNRTNSKIQMTTPVSQTKSEKSRWRISFFMPSSINIKNMPSPTDKRIEMKERSPIKVGSIIFSGTSRQKNLDKHAQILRDYLNKENYRFINKPTYSFYNPPFIPWFLRRNEVLFELK